MVDRILCGWPVDRPYPVVHCAEPATTVYLVTVWDLPIDQFNDRKMGLGLCREHDLAARGDRP